ncbi:hypothetical protein SSP24_35800 [Streptomyces spinoverrucosus]|uniref:Secreted protein n=1 Tax=Streptomyces spinoverrucosus TaxID=284043 RepID=A0A4Y3VIE0_9ACTN|nr:hypothetical protein SSP24_35800 [Streptomyces spinoverrucosus]GHB74404.1 hypothetical protein GCM10010397_51070 [Streptomyces spinoverrucosus]
MKLGRVMAAVALLAPIPFAGMTEPAAAVDSHTVLIRGSISAHDCCSIWGGNEWRSETVKSDDVRTHNRPWVTTWRSVCAGQEARAVLLVDIFLNNQEKVVVAATLKLYEGASCSSNDNDGEDYRATTVALGASRQVDLAVDSHEWGSDDKARASFIVLHG